MVVVAAKEAHISPALSIDSLPGVAKLREKNSYENFSSNIERAHLNLANYIRNKRAAGFCLAGYGAAGRGVDTMVIAKLTHRDLDVIYDMNSAFHGKYMPVSGVPVSHPNQLFQDNPDELIVFNYGYLDEIKSFYSTHPVTVTSMLDIMNGDIK